MILLFINCLKCFATDLTLITFPIFIIIYVFLFSFFYFYLFVIIIYYSSLHCTCSWYLKKNQFLNVLSFIFCLKFFNCDWCCSTSNQAATCYSSIPYGHWFKFWLIHISSRFLLVGLGQSSNPHTLTLTLLLMLSFLLLFSTSKNVCL